ncbi:hypothetical protein [Aquimonas voraii]|uniref:Uncharacterized protein n=1 Tax=Aquimonas voraii TaxID=265719 RepID=A0A1G6W253_9GAMM|nr:hypothetical protein [Aquimonas voraii]SDD59327.1 hypothetical protein SAMN04488509_10458 [Aquimonas voraii]
MESEDFAERLQTRTAVMLDRRSPPGLLRSTCEDLFNECMALAGELSEQASALASGKALSALEAARCLLDFQRSVVLLRAADAAIQRRLQQADTACLLYAGCGPFASLVLPLLARYPAERLRVCLLDVHADSLASAEALCAAAGVADRLLPSRCGDAATLRLPTDMAVDVLVAELMQRALAHEPQLAVLANLLPQCAPNVALVPARIRVSAALADLAREFDPDAERLRIALGELVELSQRSVPDLAERLADGRVDCPDVLIPRAIPQGLSLILRTRIEASEVDVLDDYDSGLTHPLVLHALGAMRGGERFACRYRLGSDPGFEIVRTVDAEPADA